MMYKIKNPYRPIRAEITEVISETPTIKTIRIVPEEPITFETGQFIELTIPGIGEAPFTPSSRPTMKDIMEITIMNVGKVTEKVHELKNGDIVGVRGPFGKGYPMDRFKGKEILVVLFDRSGEFKKLFFRGGCKTPQELLYRSEMDDWAKRKDLDIKLTVDKGDSEWKENVGVVTTILDGVEMDYESGIAIVCGPPIMMKFSTKKLIEMGFKEENIYLSMEKNMSCGIGKCGHCRIGTYYVCKDGPVFTYDKIKNFSNIWD